MQKGNQRSLEAHLQQATAGSREAGPNTLPTHSDQSMAYVDNGPRLEETEGQSESVSVWEGAEHLGPAQSLRPAHCKACPLKACPLRTEKRSKACPLKRSAMVIQTHDVTSTGNKVPWYIPHVAVSDISRGTMTRRPCPLSHLSELRRFQPCTQ